MEGGADGVSGDLLQLAGYNGGEQGIQQICTLRLAEIAGLTTDLSDAKCLLSQRISHRLTTRHGSLENLAVRRL